MIIIKCIIKIYVYDERWCTFTEEIIFEELFVSFFTLGR